MAQAKQTAPPSPSLTNRRAQWMRDNYHLLKEHGLCPRCKRDSPPQQTYCNMCLEDYRRRRIPETPEQRSQHARKAVLARWARRRLT